VFGIVRNGLIVVHSSTTTACGVRFRLPSDVLAYYTFWADQEQAESRAVNEEAEELLPFRPGTLTVRVNCFPLEQFPFGRRCLQNENLFGL